MLAALKRPAASLLIALVATSLFSLGCHRGAGGTSVRSSLQSPTPGSAVGNWIVAEVQTNPDETVPVKGRVRIVEGMNFRIAPSGVDVLADEYIGPGTKLPEIMESFYGGEYQLKQFPLANDSGFSVDLLLDYGAFFRLPPRVLYTKTAARLQLEGTKLIVRIRIEDYWPGAGGGAVLLEWNDLVVTCEPGKAVPSLAGAWPVTKVVALTDPDPNKDLPFPIPLVRRPQLRDVIEVGDDGTLTMFGTPFDAAGFIERFPSFDLLHHILFVDNGTIQGLLSSIGKSGLSFVVDFNFFHTGGLVQGDIRIAWLEAGVYHAYIVADPNPILPAGNEDGPPIPRSVPRLMRYPEDLKAAAARLQVELPESRR